MEKSAGPVLVIFDFDKTLVAKDSFRLFSVVAAGTLWRQAYVFVLAVLCKLGVITNERYKVAVLELVWAGRDAYDQEVMVNKFCATLQEIEIREVLARLHDHLSRNDIVVVLSASPEFYLLPYLQGLSPKIKGYGSKYTEVKGSVVVQNMYGDNKVVCAKQLISEFRPGAICVYTDHESDIGLVKLSTQAVLVSPSSSLVRRVKETAIPFEVLPL